MKNKFKFFLAFILIVFNCKSQTYYPMSTNSPTWTVVEYGFGTFPPTTGVTHYGLSGYTTIEGLDYFKLFVNPGGLGFTNPEDSFNIQTAFLYGIYREDSSHKVWFRPMPSGTADFLLFDFALNVNDTFCFQDAQCGVSCLPVTLVDSILVNGNYRRQIHFSYNGLEEKWIEGIGSTSGNWEGDWCFIGNISFELNCYKEKGTFSFGPCNYPIGINEINTESNALRIFPNPATNLIYIDNLKTGTAIKIINSLGQIVYSQKAVFTNNNIDIENLEKGIYFVKCSSPKKESMLKFIKQ
jgi:hypothetical protein